MDATDLYSDENIQQATVQIGATETPISTCTQYTQAWYERTNLALNKKYNGFLSKGLYQDNSDTKPYVKFTNVPNAVSCTSLSTEMGKELPNTSQYVASSKTCKLYVSKQSADKFSVIKGVGTFDGTEYPNYTLITKDFVNELSCEEVAFCVNGSYNKSAFASAAVSQCQVYMGDDYDYEEEASDDFPGIEDIEPPEDITRDENCQPLSTDGAYLSQLDGLSDIYSVQEVVTGDFGHYSNYNGHPFKNNRIMVNEKEVYPLMPTPMIEDPLVYEGEFTQTSITTKEPNIVAGAIGGSAAGAGVAAYTSKMFVNAVSWGPVGITVLVVFVIVAMLFGKEQKFNEQKFFWIIYKLVPKERYVENVYGYDHRTMEMSGSEPWQDSEGRYKLIYATLDGFTGTLEPGDFKKMLKNLEKQKSVMLTCMGWMHSNVQNIIHSAERGVVVGYPSCSKWSWSCDKRESETFTQKRDPFFKTMTNAYVGATNGVTIVVPYLGEYEIVAFDKYDNVLGTITVKEGDFREASASVAKYAQVMLGLDMDLADGIIDGNTKDACRWDLMTEWGGGVSGIYFENDYTGSNKGCQKSVDAYVEDKSAVKLSVRATNIDRPHFIDLEKPLPFANRVFLATLNEKEIRQYRCFSDFQDCETDDFSTVSSAPN